MSCENEGAHPYCRECVEVLTSAGHEEDKGPVDDPVVAERDRYRETLKEILADAEAALKWAIEDDYEPGDEDTADGLISGRAIVERCRGAFREELKARGERSGA